LYLDILSSELNHAYLEDPLHEGYGYDEERRLQGLELLRRVLPEPPQGYWCSVLGYGNPDLIEPVKSQIDRLINVMSAFRTEEIIPDNDQVEA